MDMLFIGLLYRKVIVQIVNMFMLNDSPPNHQYISEFDNSQRDAPFGKYTYITFKTYKIEIKK